MNDIQKQAIEKIEKESAEFKGNRYGEVVAKPTAEALKQFCESSEDFAQAVVNSDKTFSDCIGKVVEDITNAISDIDVYKRAVKFYERHIRHRRLQESGQVLFPYSRHQV